MSSANPYQPPESNVTTDAANAVPEFTGIGSALGFGFRLLVDHLPFLVLIQVLIYGPFEVLRTSLETNVGLTYLMSFASFAVAAIAQPAMVFLVAEGYRAGERPALRACFAHAQRCFAGTLLATLGAAIYVGLGMLLLVIPGIIWSVMYMFVTEVVVLEAPQASTAVFQRSRAITDGRKGKLFLTMVAPWLLSVGLFPLATLLQRYGLPDLPIWAITVLTYPLSLFSFTVGLGLYLSLRFGGQTPEEWGPQLRWMNVDSPLPVKPPTL